MRLRRPSPPPVMLYDIVHIYTGEFMDKIEATCPVDALAEYSMREGFADPREAILEHPEMDFFYRYRDKLAMIFTNFSVYAEPVRVDVPYGVGLTI